MASGTPQSAALYLQISKDSEGKALGVARQEDECRAWAKGTGWRVAETYVDNDLSASKKRVRRPEYERMVSDIRAGRRDAIVCWDTDRLTRQLRELADLIDLGAPIGTVSGQLDLSSSSGRFIATILGGVARQEVEHKAERVTAQIKLRARAGHPTTRKRPFGWTDNTCERLHPVEATALQQAAAGLLAGQTVRGIAVRWNRIGLLTAAGGQWMSGQVRDVLTRWSNVAVPVYRGEPLLDVAGQWAPILDRDTYDAVRAKVTTGRPVRAVRRYALSTVLLCGRCGASMRGASGRYKCIRDQGGLCQLSIRPEIADRIVVDYLMHRLARMSSSDIHGEQDARLRARVEAELVALDGERGQIAASGLNLSSRISLLKEVEGREAVLRDQSTRMTEGNALAKLLESLVPVETVPAPAVLDWAPDAAIIVNRHDIEERVARIRAAWELLDRDQHRTIAKALGTYVVHPVSWSKQRADQLPAGTPAEWVDQVRRMRIEITDKPTDSWLR